jgi:hypothetical protein
MDEWQVDGGGGYSENFNLPTSDRRAEAFQNSPKNKFISPEQATKSLTAPTLLALRAACQAFRT